MYIVMSVCSTCQSNEDEKCVGCKASFCENCVLDDDFASYCKACNEDNIDCGRCDGKTNIVESITCKHCNKIICGYCIKDCGICRIDACNSCIKFCSEYDCIMVCISCANTCSSCDDHLCPGDTFRCKCGTYCKSCYDYLSDDVCNTCHNQQLLEATAHYNQQLLIATKLIKSVYLEQYFYDDIVKIIELY
jgi:hypothetical protein